MVTHSFYESDNRVTRYASALTARGDTVDVFALRRSPELPAQETIDGVNLFRIQDRFGKTERTRFSYLWPLLRFLKKAAVGVTRRHSRAPYDLVHIHNVPDFMVFSAWYPKLTGARILLDIHDIVPEFYSSKFNLIPKGMTYALLNWMERISAAFAHHIIIANDLWLPKYASRTHTDGRCTAFINNVDSSVFTARPRGRQDGKYVILFPGGLQWHQGVDIALQAFAHIHHELPNAEFHIYGDGNARESLVRLATELELNGSVRFFEPRSVREIAAIMADADLGVVPKRADSFGNEAYSTKIMEFMAVGVPVVVSSTKVDRYYFNESVVRFFPSGDAPALARQVVDLLRNSEERRRLVHRASEYAASHCWENRKDDYLNLVDFLCDADVIPRPAQVAQKAA
jgi:glycosyltransferase involved in cell wall biosynthesis